MTLGDFTLKYSARKPRIPAQNDDELRLLTSSDGVREMAAPPMEIGDRRAPRKKGDPGCHLRVVVSASCPFIHERAVVAPPLRSGRVKHTNLTGGGSATQQLRWRGVV